jgi:hypothetical protein
MNKPIGTLTLCGGFAVMLALCGTAQAQITFTSGGSLTAWNGTPVYTSLANSSLSGASTGQGSQTIAGTYGVLAETFTPSSTFTLGSFNVLLGVNTITSPTYEVNLYDLGAAGTVSVSSSTATYGPGTSTALGTSLFSDNTVTFSAASGGEVQGTFTMDSADQVTLQSGQEYALEIWTPSADASAGVTWYRGSTADAGGQMFSSADAVNDDRETLAAAGQAGGAPRTGALALYSVAAVPEPTTLALIGSALVAGVLVRRNKK